MRHLHLRRKTIIQMIILTVVALTAGAVMIFSYIGLPGMLFGVGQYKVTLQLPEAGGLYPRGNVTYRGTEVGRVQERQTDRQRRRGRPVAELGLQDSRGSRRPGAQRVGGR